MFAVDTNILIYAHFDGYPQHAKARVFCEGLLSADDDWCIGWQVRPHHDPPLHSQDTAHHRAGTHGARPYLTSERGHVLSHTAQHGPVLLAVAATVPTARGNFIHDVHYAALLREHGVSRIYTADSDFEKLDFLEVVNPTA